MSGIPSKTLKWKVCTGSFLESDTQSQHPWGSEGCRIGQGDVLHQDAVTTEASADSLGSSGARIALQSSLKLRQSVGPLYAASASHWTQAAFKRENNPRQGRTLADDNSCELPAVNTG